MESDYGSEDKVYIGIWKVRSDQNARDGSIMEDMAEKKSMAIEAFGDATFALHKWHANMAVLENDEKPTTRE